MLTAVQVKPDVYWVGGVDWNARSFHGYTTEDGITYNAYLIMDEKVTLIDTAKSTFKDEFLQRISAIVDPSKIDVLICNHVEMDHSGNIPTIKELAPNVQIYCSPMAVKELTAHYGDLGYTPVKTGDTLSIGKRTLAFVVWAVCCVSPLNASLRYALPLVVLLPVMWAGVAGVGGRWDTNK